jgi:hypothetical protein
MTNVRAFRRSMTKARRLRIWTRENGICKRCGVKVPWTGPEVEYDHYSQIAISCDDSDENIFPLHSGRTLEACHKIKTAADAKARAKVIRQGLKHRGEFPASPFPLRSRGFGRRWSL